MLQIHPDARTTPVVRAEIARSDEPSGVLARRYGVSSETVRKWRKRGPDDCLDHSARPHRLPWKATEEERAVVCALRRATNFALDDLTFVVAHFLPHLNRDSVWRILRAEGLSRRGAEPPTAALLGPAEEGSGPLPGLRPRLRAHRHQAPADIKHLPTSSTCRSCRPRMVSAASATSTSPSTGAPAPSTWPSRTTGPRRAPSRSCEKPPPPSPSGSPTC